MCLYPKLIPNKRYLPTKKNGGVPPVCPDERLRYVTAACGDCYECRKQKQRQWMVRMSEGNRQTPNAYFLTLTIDDKSYKELKQKYNLKDNNDIATKAIRLCLEKSTKTNRKIRKALVYYRTRARENRKITSSWDSMGLGKWKESNGQLEIRNHIHRIFCE